MSPPPPEIFVRTPLRHPRLRYALDIVGDDLGYRFRFYNDRSVFPRPEPEFLLHYASEGEPALPHHSLLAGRDIAPAPAATDLTDYLVTDEGPDLLACIFYLVSRYEEYRSDARDRHGRFPATASHNNRPDRPLVREWTAQLGRQLRQWFADLPPPRHHPFEFQPTYDIDMLWAYHHRGLRGVAAGLRDLISGNGRRAIERFTSRVDEDPFRTLSSLDNLHRSYRLNASYFWLVSNNKSRLDSNPFPIPEDQRAWMRKTASTATVGLHPGYLSSVEEGVLESELVRAEAIVGNKILHSRQHFLRFRLPVTYRMLLAAGLRHDYSMGFADRAGWRAGTNLPFPWYDLERERTTKLTVHSFAAMDVTLKNYEGLSAEDAGARVFAMAERIVPFGGPFPLLWHNSSFADAYGWEGWWAMYEKTVGRLAGL